MLARIAHDLGRRIKPHGLGIQKSCREHLWMMAFKPCGNIDEVRKARRMAFGKTIFAKSLDLVEAVLGKRPVVATVHHAVDHLLLHGMDGAHLAEGCHGTAQLIGFIGRELCRLYGNTHGLLLKQRHAFGFLQNIA